MVSRVAHGEGGAIGPSDEDDRDVEASRLYDASDVVSRCSDGVVGRRARLPAAPGVEPQVRIERLQVQGQWLYPGAAGLAELPLGARDLKFEFTVPAFQPMRPVHLRYRLAGYDDSWRELDAPHLRSATYTNLPPGEYSFEVADFARAEPMAGSARLPLAIRPHWHETLAFRLLLPLVLAGLVYLLYVGLQRRYARHREHHLIEHANRVVEHLWAIDRSRPLHAIVLAGPTEALVALRHVLPRALDRIVVGTAAVEMFASTADVVRHVAKIDEAAREREDEELVSRILDAAGAAGNATVGWDETLQALGEGRAHLLVFPAGASLPGVQCPNGHFLATAGESCPLCNERLFSTGDIVEAAIGTAQHMDTRVHFLAPRASSLLERRGAAALLRY